MSRAQIVKKVKQGQHLDAHIYKEMVLNTQETIRTTTNQITSMINLSAKGHFTALTSSYR